MSNHQQMSDSVMSLSLVSWNVAGWRTTLQLIQDRYGGLLPWLEKIQCDLLLLQEVKVTRAKLISESVWHPPGGWDAFWSCCVSPPSYSGVATFARAGLTLRADSAPFRASHLLRYLAPHCEDVDVFKGTTAYDAVLAAASTIAERLNNEGRALLTVHQHFALINVYAPTSSRQKLYGSLQHKISFHEAISGLIREIKSQGIPVVLAGDLNLSYRAQDVHLGHVAVPLKDLQGPGPAFAKLRGCVPQIERVLGSLTLRPVTSRRKSWAATVMSGDAKRSVLKGSYDSEFQAELHLRLLPHSVAATLPRFDASLEACNRPPLLAWRAGWIPVSELQNVIHEIKRWTEMPVDASTVDDVAAHCGEPQSAVAGQQWMKAFLAAGFVDSFAACWPRHKERCSCWSQWNNARFSNEGIRVDYILLDQALLRICECLPGGRGTDRFHDPSPAAAIQDATGGDCWTPAPMSGGGLPAEPNDSLEYAFQPRRTGLLYTPPRFSDHVPVTCLLEGLEEASVELAKDKATQAAMIPRQHSLFHFFKTERKQRLDADPRPTKMAKPQATLYTFFGHK